MYLKFYYIMNEEKRKGGNHMITIPKNLSVREISEATCISAKRIENWDLTEEEEIRVILFCERFE